MNRKLLSPSKESSLRWFYWVSALALLLWGNAWGAYQDIDIKTCPPPPVRNCPVPNVICYAAQRNTAIAPPEQIAVINATGNVFWDLAAGAGCTGSAPNFVCAGMNVTVPAIPTVSVPHAETVKIGSGTLTKLASSSFTLTVTADNGTGIPTCSQSYLLRVTSNGGGWGDPHITTVDGVNYDFQSAGEFIALRGGGLEIQTRQTPIATTSIPGANPYTGLSTCVAVYTAVAARVGPHRVSYQPNISGVPDPRGLQLRVDGVLTTLGPEGIDLGSEGRIVKSPVGGGIEIHYSDGTKLVVTPAWWDAQQQWYLNVNVYDTTANEGLMGQLATRSWLPALPDGTSLGPKPAALHDRYIALYETFADAWRVTDATSLFDYAPDTSTATFTLDSWPRESPSSCAIPEKPSAQPLDASIAEKHCSAIVDKNTKANCVFDVMVTGHPGFAETYLLTQQLQPGAIKITVKNDKDSTKYGESVTFTATVTPMVSRSGVGIPTGTVQFILDNGKMGSPVALDSNGRAAWSTSSLPVGNHQVVATYIPPSFGGIFLASSSPEESHTVIETYGKFSWLAILLIIIILIAIVWWYRTR